MSEADAASAQVRTISIQQADGRLTAHLDLCAAGLSTLCLAHCLALPLLVSVMPLVAQSIDSHLVHQILAVLAVPVSLRVLWKSLPVPGNGLFIGAALTGLGLLLLAAFVHAVEAHEESITVAGGVALASAHLWHWTRQRSKGRDRVLPLGDDAERPQLG